VEPQAIEGALGKIGDILNMLYQEEYDRALAKAEARRKAAAKEKAARKKATVP
jgi:C4-type Zn-finger protein